MIDTETSSRIGVALNESSLLGLEYDSQRNIAAATFSVLTLPNADDPSPVDPRRQIVFSRIGRISVALRNAFWNVTDTPPIPISIDELLPTVQSFNGQPIYGWEFINHDDPSIETWKNRLSLDHKRTDGGTENRISLLQESSVPERHLDLWIWFDQIEIRDSNQNKIPIDEFVAGGDRWWEALHDGDDRTDGYGISPGGNAT